MRKDDALNVMWNLITICLVFILVAALIKGVHSAYFEGPNEEDEKVVFEELGQTYHLFTTTSQEKYLDFLDRADASQYEIVNISISGAKTAWYRVTYKLLE